MIAKKGEFYSGAGMMAVFVVILIVMFMPVFKGHNGLDYLDSLYNSISKGSAYYIPALQDEAKAYAGSNVKLTLTMQDETQARQTSLLFQKGGRWSTSRVPRSHWTGTWGQCSRSASRTPI
jgi:hypothetical protein